MTAPDYAMNRSVLRDLTVGDLRQGELLYEWETNHRKVEVKPFVRIATKSAVVDVSFEEFRSLLAIRVKRAIAELSQDGHNLRDTGSNRAGGES